MYGAAYKSIVRNGGTGSSGEGLQKRGPLWRFTVQLQRVHDQLLIVDRVLQKELGKVRNR